MHNSQVKAVKINRKPKRKTAQIHTCMCEYTNQPQHQNHPATVPGNPGPAGTQEGICTQITRRNLSETETAMLASAVWQDRAEVNSTCGSFKVQHLTYDVLTVWGDKSIHRNITHLPIEQMLKFPCWTPACPFRKCTFSAVSLNGNFYLTQTALSTCSCPC